MTPVYKKSVKSVIIPDIYAVMTGMEDRMIRKYWLFMGNRVYVYMCIHTYNKHTHAHTHIHIPSYICVWECGREREREGEGEWRESECLYFHS